MPLPKNRSTSMRKVHVRTPKGGKTIHYRRRKKGKRHSCAVTGAKLQGVNSRHRVAKSMRRPNRKFGGNLTSATSARVIKFATRVREGSMKLEEVDVRLLSHVKGLLTKK